MDTEKKSSPQANGKRTSPGCWPALLCLHCYPPQRYNSNRSNQRQLIHLTDRPPMLNDKCSVLLWGCNSVCICTRGFSTNTHNYWRFSVCVCNLYVLITPVISWLLATSHWFGVNTEESHILNGKVCCCSGKLQFSTELQYQWKKGIWIGQRKRVAVVNSKSATGKNISRKYYQKKTRAKAVKTADIRQRIWERQCQNRSVEATSHAALKKCIIINIIIIDTSLISTVKDGRCEVRGVWSYSMISSAPLSSAALRIKHSCRSTS